MAGPPNQCVLNAVCVCDKGSAPTTLVTGMAPTVSIERRVVATIADVQFAGTFGRCGILNSPCEYEPAAPWSVMVPNLLFGGLAPLVQGAMLPCSKGGIITIVAMGQSSLGTARPGDEPANDPTKDFVAQLGMGVAGAALDANGKLILNERRKLPDTDSNRAARGAMGAVGVGSRALGAAGVAVDVYQIATADDSEERERAAGGLAGGVIVGAAATLVPIPGATVVGAALGSAIGSAVAPTVVDGAGWLAGKVGDALP